MAEFIQMPEMTEVELLELRKIDAWLPSEPTRRILVSIASIDSDSKDSSVPGFTLPGLMAGEIGVGSGLGGGSNMVAGKQVGSGDPIRTLLVNRLPNEAAVSDLRCVIEAEHVSQDTDGLHQLIARKWYRAALDLTHRLLTSCGHGLGKTGQPSARITPYSAHLWLTRFALLKQTQQFTLLERELEAFSTLDSPDVYFEYQPTLYPGRKGSIIPFSLRLLHAELPQFLNRRSEALDRLYFLSAVVTRLISNLKNGYTEDGIISCPNSDYQSSSLALWRRRECRIYSSCLSVYLSERDFPSAIDTIHAMIACLEPLGEHHFLYGLLGRVFIQLGDVTTAEAYFNQAIAGFPPDLSSTRAQRALFDGIIAIGQGKFEDAKRLFRKALEINPLNVTAANNLAVCSLYLGDLEEGVRLFESLLPSPEVENPSTFAIHSTIVSNLAILYEVESDGSEAKKMRLLERFAAVPGEPINAAAFKL